MSIHETKESVETSLKELKKALHSEVSEQKLFDIVKDITEIISRLPKIGISHKDSEQILRIVGDEIMTKSETENFRHVFCRSKEFMKVLLNILQGFWICHCETYLPEVSNDGEAFSGHKSYEIGLFYLMMFVEQPASMKETILTLTESDLLDDYLHLLGSNLKNEICYHTQELAVDIICRCYVYFRKHQPNYLPILLNNIPQSLSCLIQDPNVGPLKILQDMRIFLQDVNKKNTNINSFRVASCSICLEEKLKTDGTKEASTKRLLQNNGWIHLGLYSFDVDLSDHNIIPTIPYQALIRVNFITEPPSTKMQINGVPDLLMDCLKKEELNDGKPILFFQFGNLETKIEFENKLKQRVEEAESYENEVIEHPQQNERISVATMRVSHHPQKQVTVEQKENFDAMESSGDQENIKTDKTVTCAVQAAVPVTDPEKIKKESELKNVMAASEDTDSGKKSFSTDLKKKLSKENSREISGSVEKNMKSPNPETDYEKLKKSGKKLTRGSLGHKIKVAPVTITPKEPSKISTRQNRFKDVVTEAYKEQEQIPKVTPFPSSSSSLDISTTKPIVLSTVLGSSRHGSVDSSNVASAIYGAGSKISTSSKPLEELWPINTGTAKNDNNKKHKSVWSTLSYEPSKSSILKATSKYESNTSSAKMRSSLSILDIKLRENSKYTSQADWNDDDVLTKESVIKDQSNVQRSGILKDITHQVSVPDTSKQSKSLTSIVEINETSISMNRTSITNEKSSEKENDDSIDYPDEDNFTEILHTSMEKENVVNKSWKTDKSIQKSRTSKPRKSELKSDKFPSKSSKSSVNSSEAQKNEGYDDKQTKRYPTGNISKSRRSVPNKTKVSDETFGDENIAVDNTETNNDDNKIANDIKKRSVNVGPSVLEKISQMKPLKFEPLNYKSLNFPTRSSLEMNITSNSIPNLVSKKQLDTNLNLNLNLNLKKGLSLQITPERIKRLNLELPSLSIQDHEVQIPDKGYSQYDENKSITKSETGGDNSQYDSPESQNYLRKYHKREESSDDDGATANIFNMLLEEIKLMQKNRAEKRRNKQIKMAIDTATAQVQSYLDSWISSSCNAIQARDKPNRDRFEYLCGEAQKILNDLDMDLQLVSSEIVELDNLVRSTQAQIGEIGADIQRAAKNFKEADISVRKSLVNKKNNIINDTKKVIENEAKDLKRISNDNKKFKGIMIR